MNRSLALYVILFLASALCFVGCSKKADKTVEYVLNDFDLVLEGPLFEGSNEAQIKLAFLPEEVLKSAGYDKSHIKDIKVKTVSLSVQGQENFNLFGSTLLQLVGGESALTPIAVVSPVPANVTQLQPVPTNSASFAGLKNSENFYFVLDANLKEGYEENITLKGKIAFDIEVSK